MDVDNTTAVPTGLYMSLVPSDRSGSSAVSQSTDTSSTDTCVSNDGENVGEDGLDTPQPRISFGSLSELVKIEHSYTPLSNTPVSEKQVSGVPKTLEMTSDTHKTEPFTIPVQSTVELPNTPGPVKLMLNNKDQFTIPVQSTTGVQIPKYKMKIPAASAKDIVITSQNPKSAAQEGSVSKSLTSIITSFQPKPFESENPKPAAKAETVEFKSMLTKSSWLQPTSSVSQRSLSGAQQESILKPLVSENSPLQPTARVSQNSQSATQLRSTSNTLVPKSSPLQPVSCGISTQKQHGITNLNTGFLVLPQGNKSGSSKQAVPFFIPKTGGDEEGEKEVRAAIIRKLAESGMLQGESTNTFAMIPAKCQAASKNQSGASGKSFDSASAFKSVNKKLSTFQFTRANEMSSDIIAGAPKSVDSASAVKSVNKKLSTFQITRANEMSSEIIAGAPKSLDSASAVKSVNKKLSMFQFTQANEMSSDMIAGAPTIKIKHPGKRYILPKPPGYAQSNKNIEQPLTQKEITSAFPVECLPAGDHIQVTTETDIDNFIKTETDMDEIVPKREEEDIEPQFNSEAAATESPEDAANDAEEEDEGPRGYSVKEFIETIQGYDNVKEYLRKYAPETPQMFKYLKTVFPPAYLSQLHAVYAPRVHHSQMQNIQDKFVDPVRPVVKTTEKKLPLKKKTLPPKKPKKNKVEAPRKSTFICDGCGFVVSSGRLRYHILKHVKTKLLRCVKNRQKIKSHSDEEKPFRCNMCTECCNTKDELKEHIRDHCDKNIIKCWITSKGNEEYFVCMKCQFACRQVKRMRRHMESHP